MEIYPEEYARGFKGTTDVILIIGTAPYEMNYLPPDIPLMQIASRPEYVRDAPVQPVAALTGDIPVILQKLGSSWPATGRRQNGGACWQRLTTTGSARWKTTAGTAAYPSLPGGWRPNSTGSWLPMPFWPLLNSKRVLTCYSTGAKPFLEKLKR